jgi:putative addiction module component (TIGR02574 family)
MINPEFASLLQLSRAERLQLVEDLWDSIAQEGESLPVSNTKLAELRLRKEKFDNNPNSGRSWEEVKRRARTVHD